MSWILFFADWNPTNNTESAVIWAFIKRNDMLRYTRSSDWSLQHLQNQSEANILVLGLIFPDYVASKCSRIGISECSNLSNVGASFEYLWHQMKDTSDEGHVYLQIRSSHHQENTNLNNWETGLYRHPNTSKALWRNGHTRV